MKLVTQGATMRFGGLTAVSDLNLEIDKSEKVSGNKVKRLTTVKHGLEGELAKKVVKLLKDSKLKVTASIQGESVRVQGAKRDVLQDAIALMRKSITDFPLQYQNFRD